MNNKVLIKLDIPKINTSYDIFIPVNETIWKVITLLRKGICEISNKNISTKLILINKQTNEIYDLNKVVYETNIRNGTELIMLEL